VFDMQDTHRAPTSKTEASEREGIPLLFPGFSGNIAEIKGFDA
jgi:hypothetical protein